MHAASVYPEPGSNSLKNYISTPYGVNTFFQSFSDFKILLLCLVCVFFWNFRDLSHDTSLHRSLCFISRLVVQFSMTYAAQLLPSDLVIIPHTLPFVNTFLKSFSHFFLARSSSLARYLLRFSCAAPLVYHFPLLFVKLFFAFFL